MSLNRKKSLYVAARETARDLRKTETTAEHAMWQRLRNRGFLGIKFHRQFPILHDSSGRETYSIADFCCPALHLVVEIDGGINATQLEADRRREEHLRLAGYHIIRFTNAEVEGNLDGVLEALGQAIRPLLRSEPNR